MLNPAHTVIEICGGTRVVADMVGRSQNRVRRWTYPKERGGTGGRIPSDMQVKILEVARLRGIPLQPSDFFRAATQPPEDAA